MEPISRASPAYRRDVDGLRAIAILLVVGYHVALPGFASGFVGVDIFFVISGYVIGRQLFAELRERGAVDIAAFAARRMRRLLPVACVVWSFVLVVGAFVYFPFGDLQKLLKSAIAAALYSSNLYFAWASWDYFDGSLDQMPLLHMWSLSLEEQFYVLVAVLLLAVPPLRRRFGSSRAVVAAMLVVLALGSLTVAGSWHGEETAFFLPPMRLFEFVPGLLIALFEGQLTGRDRSRGLAAAAALGSIAIAASVARLALNGWLVPAAIAVAGASVLVLPVDLANRGWVSRILASGPMVRIGRLSYGWYLWHWPLLAMTRYFLLGKTGLLMECCVAILALALAQVTYSYVEQPFRARRISDSLSFVGTGAMASAGIAVAALALALYAKFAMVNFDAYKVVRRAEEGATYLSSECLVRDGGAPVPTKEQCRFGDPAASPTVVVWGDSHAAALVPGLRDEFRRLGVAGLQRTHVTCPGVPGYRIPLRVRPALRNDCVRYNAGVFDEVLALAAKRPVSLILAARWIPYLAEAPMIWSQKTALDRMENGITTTEARAALERPLDTMLGELRTRNVRVLIVAQVPEQPFPAARCLYRGRGAACEVTRAAAASYRAGMVSMLTELAQRHDNVRIADVFDSVCDATGCDPRRDGEVLYLDADHLNDVGSRFVASHLRPQLDWLTAESSVDLRHSAPVDR